MPHRFLTMIAAALLLAAIAAAPQMASAHWTGAQGALIDAQSALSDVQQVSHRRWRRHLWWGVPFVAAPFIYHHYYYGAPYGECGWVVVKRWRDGNPVYRRVWRCW